MKKLDLQSFQERLNKIHPNQFLIAIEWNGDKQNSIVKCNLCGQTYIKKGGYFLDKRKISICKQCFPTQANKLKEDWQPPQEYKLISEYKGMHHKVLIKHLVCGFIWNITPSNLKQGKGCPKCNKKVSKGEQKIKNWLESHNIDYIYQYPLDINNKHYKIDFYLPKIKLYIEYNGEQHYNPITFFGGEEKYKLQCQRDKEVQNFLQNKLITIPYFDFENIESILESSTTISQESRL